MNPNHAAGPVRLSNIVSPFAGEEEVRGVVRNHRDRGIPLDSVCLDIDYMVDYKNFSWKPEAFPDWKRFNSEMKEEHIHLIPIIDAGVKKEDGYGVYEEGKSKGFFCKNKPILNQLSINFVFL